MATYNEEVTALRYGCAHIEGRTMKIEQNDELLAAVVSAIRNVGLTAFKSTSLFASNERQLEVKKAA